MTIAALPAPSLDEAMATALLDLPRRSGLDDAHGRDLSAAIGRLQAGGLLAAPVEFEDAAGVPVYGVGHGEVLAALVRLGAADLSLGRLYEGHVNALQLVCLYGDAAQRQRLRADAQGGHLFGVWGADGAPPFAAEPLGGGRWRLSGSKRYASGIGLVSRALVPYSPPEGPMRLVLLDVAEPARLDASAWRMSGMRASRSGTFDASGIEIGPDSVIGAPGDYKREPFFVGGIWRCAAVQLGAIERILSLTVSGLRGGGRLDHPLQLARIGEMMMEARSARLFVEDAARRVESAGGGEDVREAVALAAFARLRTEAAGQAVIRLAERAIGLGAFAEAHPAEPILRDLAVYLRQANPDQTLLEHTRALAERIGAEDAP